MDNDIAGHLTDETVSHAASAIGFTPTGSIIATDVQAAIAEIASEGGGSASAISVLDAAANFTATDVEGTLAEIQANIDALPTLAADDPTEVGLATAGGVTTLTLETTIARQAAVATNAFNIAILNALQPLRSRLTADSAACSDTTPIDSGLSVTVAANGTYELEGYLLWISPAADDISFSWVIPSGTAGFWSTFAPPSTAASDGVIRASSVGFGSSISAAGADATRMGAPVRGLVRVGGTGGTFKLQFAKLADSAGTDSNMEADSWLRLTPTA